ncbi:MAG TPA: chemotaxis protein CheA [Planctomycetota bacterium]|nr:chemotaxis protein CheA [Planctomycetota bacterium]
MAVDPKELHHDFVVETTELLAMAEDLMLKLENSTDLEQVHALFRAFHTIKGTSAFLGFKSLSEASNAVESILDGFRARRFAPTRKVIDLMLLYIDAVRAFLQMLHLNGAEKALKQDFTRLSERLHRAHQALETGTPDESSARVGAIAQPQASAKSTPPPPAAAPAAVSGAPLPAIPTPPPDIANLLNAAPSIAVTWALPWEKGDPKAQPVKLGPPVPGAPLATADGAPNVAPNGAPRAVPVAGGKKEPGASGKRTAIPSAGGAPIPAGPAAPAPREMPTGAVSTDRHPVTPASAAAAPNAAKQSGDTTRIGPALERTDHETRITVAVSGAAPAPGSGDPRRETHVIERTFLPTQKGSTKLIPMHRGRDAAKPGDTALFGARPTLRVDAGQIDELINLVGEMVLSRNRLVEASGGSMKKSFDRSHRKKEHADPVLLPELVEMLDKSTTAVHKAVMRLRMVSLEPFFQRFPRLVHDLSGQLNKMIRLEIAGEATELDKSVVEAIADPLVHLVRNAAYHGIEPAEERVKAGKPRAGTIFLSARPEGESVAITLEDDGRGLNIQRIAEKAVRTGVITADQLTRMQPHEIIELVFLPGFTTEDAVGAISGRGVGLDVVRDYINQIGGSVSLSTEPGHGTRITLNLPMTLAILRALLVEVNGMTFAIPLSAVRKTRRLQPGDARELHGQWLLTDLHTAESPLSGSHPGSPASHAAPGASFDAAGASLPAHPPAGGAPADAMATGAAVPGTMVPFHWADEWLGFAHTLPHGAKGAKGAKSISAVRALAQGNAAALRGLRDRPVTEASYAVLIGMGGRMVAWGVDKLLGQEDIVAKSLPAILGPVPGLAGATISSDGATILIADVSGFTTQVES